MWRREIWSFWKCCHFSNRLRRPMVKCVYPGKDLPRSVLKSRTSRCIGVAGSPGIRNDQHLVPTDLAARRRILPPDKIVVGLPSASVLRALRWRIELCIHRQSLYPNTPKGFCPECPIICDGSPLPAPALRGEGQPPKELDLMTA